MYVYVEYWSKEVRPIGNNPVCASESHFHTFLF